MNKVLTLSMLGIALGVQPLARTGALLQVEEKDYACNPDPADESIGICCVKGDKGAQGARGPAGPPGPKGAKGVDGTDGPVGAKGPSGNKGPTGAVGSKGAVGIQGDQGDDGPQGPAGAKGATGQPGQTGPDGDIGEPGATGAVGDTGAEGDGGDAGPAGPAGSGRVVPRVGIYAFPAWTAKATQCKDIPYSTSFAAAPKVQASIGHNTFTGSTTHNALMGWIEDIGASSFKYCVSEPMSGGTGQTWTHDGAHDGNMKINYIAFDSSEPGVTTASSTFTAGYASKKSSLTCLTLGVSPATEDVVLGTSVHRGSKGTHQPVMTWSKSSGQFCSRETSKYDQKHWGQSIDAAVFKRDSLADKGAQGGQVTIANVPGGAVCSTVNFPTAFDAAPAVVTFPAGTGQDSVIAWVEGVSTTNFRACTREGTDEDGSGSVSLNWLAMKPTSPLSLSFLELSEDSNVVTLSAAVAAAAVDSSKCPDSNFKGDKGDVGPPGPPGPPGLPGEKGNQGPTGKDGPVGDEGVTGDAGAPGAQGDQGPVGAVGNPGVAGPKGPKGDQGVAGAGGKTGGNGADGNAGASGQAGPKGTAGPPGPAGAPGKATLLEITSSLRASNMLRTMGNSYSALHFYKGSVGDTGAVGPAGPEGPQGMGGQRGIDGNQGATGAKGADGATGPQGPTGALGIKGLKGAVGPQGAAGIVGDAGSAGETGPKGSKGATGQPGNKGATGTKGSKGDEGPPGPPGPSP